MSDTLNDLAALASECAAKPDDWKARLVYADALEESGEVRAARAHRALASLQQSFSKGLAVKGLPRALQVWVKSVSRKQRCMLSISATVIAGGFHWEGGSRATYYRCGGFPDGGPVPLSLAGISPWTGPTSVTLQTADGAILEAGTFCGKPSTPHLTIHPDYMLNLGAESLEALAGA